MSITAMSVYRQYNKKQRIKKKEYRWRQEQTPEIKV